MDDAGYVREICSSVPSQFLFAEMHLCLQITLGAQESEAAESVKTVGHYLDFAMPS